MRGGGGGGKQVVVLTIASTELGPDTSLQHIPVYVLSASRMISNASHNI